MDAMRNLYTLAMLIFVFAMLCCQHCVGQTNIVFYGTNASSIGVSFVDTNLSASAKTSIVADLQLCLQAWGKETQFRLGADDPDFVANLYNSDSTLYNPKAIDVPDNLFQTG